MDFKKGVIQEDYIYILHDIIYIVIKCVQPDSGQRKPHHLMNLILSDCMFDVALLLGFTPVRIELVDLAGNKA